MQQKVDSACTTTPEVPTSLAVADAITTYRTARSLSVAELARIVRLEGYDLSTADLLAIENREQAATVDHLMALAYALDTTPAMLLGHLPRELPLRQGQQIASGLPADLGIGELRDWLTGRTTLNRQARLIWWANHIAHLALRARHLEDQLDRVHTEMQRRGGIVEREADAPPIIRPHPREAEPSARVAELELPSWLRI